VTDWAAEYGDRPPVATGSRACSAGVYSGLCCCRAFRPADRLGTGMGRRWGARGLLRASLVVLQFAISDRPWVSPMIVMFAQIRYARQVDLGFDRHDLVAISGAGGAQGPPHSIA